MWNIFKNKESSPNLFTTDIHSHLLSNLDDGVKSIDQAIEVIETFMALGFKKSITTPHIMSDTYRNSAETIYPKLHELKQSLKDKSIDYSIEAAAEYYFDETLLDLVTQKKSLLTFGRRYFLFETNTFAEPMMLNEFIFQLKVQGYQPVMAHPERYQYLQNNLKRVEDLVERGVFMQINFLSLSGHYSSTLQKNANELVKNRLVHFLGSDCHTPQQAKLIPAVIKSKHFQKALELPLLNYSI